MQLNSKQRAHLRKLGQPLNAILTVGKEGVTDEVVAALENHLEYHELVKVRWLKTSPTEADEIEARLSQATRSAIAGRIGRTLLLYRRSKTDPKIELPES